MKKFIWLSEAWYADASLTTNGVTDEVIFGFYGESRTSEMVTRWHSLMSCNKPVPRLEVFDGSFALLYELAPLLADLAERDDKLIQPREFCELLTTHGFVDATPRERSGK